MKVFLLRHATRNFTLGDVPLNDEGMEQALSLSENSKLLQTKTILSSPKTRAHMTISPLAEKLNIQIQQIEDLDQMRSGESEESFRNRVQKILESVEKNQWTAPLVICSHSDWLSTATQIIPCDDSTLNYHMFPCASFLEFDIKEGLWSLA